MDSPEQARALFRSHIEAAEAASDAVAEPLTLASRMIVEALLSGHKILCCADAGSAANGSHFATLMLTRYQRERPGLPALDLNANLSALAAIAAEYGYDQVYARQIQALGQAGDLLVALATDLESRSVMEAILAAHDREMRVVLFAGGECEPLEAALSQGDVGLCPPGDTPARILEVHLVALHGLCELIDAHLLGS
jgi:D-sedoheptulose 7-phosphate isomerase